MPDLHECSSCLTEFRGKKCPDCGLPAGYEITTIRAKRRMNGASTLAEAAEKMRAFAASLDKMAAEGWGLTGVVEDDYGFCMRKKPEA